MEQNCGSGPESWWIGLFLEKPDPDPHRHRIYGRSVGQSISVADSDPGYSAFFTPDPGYGIGKKAGSGIRIRDEQPGSYIRELRNNFLGWKYLHSFMKIRDGKNLDLGSGMEKIRIRDGKKFGSGINIPDPHHWLQYRSGWATLRAWLVPCGTGRSSTSNEYLYTYPLT